MNDTLAVDWRRPPGGGKVHAVYADRDRTICCGGMNAADWPSVRPPGSREDDRLCSRTQTTLAIAQSDPIAYERYSPRLWAVRVYHRPGSGKGATNVHWSADNGDTTLCRVERASSLVTLREYQGDERFPVDERPTRDRRFCGNCAELAERGRIR